jgi:putative endonuclease
MKPRRRNGLIEHLRAFLVNWRIIPAPNRLGDDPLGRKGEHAAAKLLRSSGYRVLAQNAVTPIGEADIVALREDGETVAIVEVKSRVRGENRERGRDPEESVTRRKRRKLADVARHLARENGWKRVSIEVVAVEYARAEDASPAAIRHHRP